MEIINSSYEFLTPLTEESVLERYRIIEEAGRTCYKSEWKNPDLEDSITRKFVAGLAGKKHYSVLEHVSVSVRIICDRAIANEIVRHRIASYSQASTRYISYKDGITVIKPHWFEEGSAVNQYSFSYAVKTAEQCYKALIEEGCPPQDARSVLPLALKTEIVVTMNLRAWLEMFPKRTVKGVHPDMLAIMIPLQNEFKKAMPEIFGEVV